MSHLTINTSLHRPPPSAAPCVLSALLIFPKAPNARSLSHDAQIYLPLFFSEMIRCIGLQYESKLHHNLLSRAVGPIGYNIYVSPVTY